MNTKDLPRLEKLTLRDNITMYPMGLTGNFERFKYLRELRLPKFNFLLDNVIYILRGRPEGFFLAFNKLTTPMKTSTLKKLLKDHERYILSFKLAHPLFLDKWPQR